MSIENDQIFIWGSNEHNQCYYTDEKLVSVFNTFDKRQSFIKKIKSVSSGASHCLILTDEGEVYSWGNNSKGQAGSGEFSYKYPRKLIFGHKCDKTNGIIDIKIRKISAGGMFSVFITNCGCIIRKGSIFGDPSQSMEISLSNLTGNVTQVCCGVSHVMLLLSSGHVACFGRNMYGQIGVPRQDLDRNIETVSTPRIVTGDFRHRITKIATGSYHSLSCDEINQIFCWGYGIPCGVLNGHVMQPSVLPGLSEPIRTLAAGSSHSLILTESNTLYCVGGNEFGQAMPNCDMKFIAPLSGIDYFTDGIVDVFCGENYSVVKQDNGDISMWGKNSLLINSALPISFRFSTPQTVISKEMLGDTKLVSLSCGSWHILCHTSSSNRDTKNDTQLEEVYTNRTDNNDSVTSNELNSLACNNNVDSMIPLDDHRMSSDKDINSSSKQRERTYTTLRELYSKTPNQLRHVPNYDHTFHSMIPTQNSDFQCSATRLFSRTNDYNNDLVTVNDIQPLPSVYDQSHHLFIESSFVKENNHFPDLFSSNSDSSRNVPEVHEVINNNHMRMQHIGQGPKYTETRLHELPRLFSYKPRVKQSTLLTMPIHFQKSKTEFISPQKNYFMPKRSVDEIHQSPKFPHRVDLQLSKDYTTIPHRTFIFAGKMKTSSGKTSTVLPDVKWWKSS